MTHHTKKNTRLSSLILGTALLGASPVLGGTSTSMGCGAGRCGAGRCGSQMKPAEDTNTSESKTSYGRCGAGMPASGSTETPGDKAQEQ